MLVLRVHHADGTVRILKLDNVVANMMRSARELHAQRLVHPLFEVRSTHLVFSNTDVVWE